MSAGEQNPFEELYSDLITEDTFPNSKPLLAHYTSIECVESIMKNEEIWFSNPLFMNDLEELRFGLLEGRNWFWDNPDIKLACQTEERVRILEHHFDTYFSEFENKVAFDIYAFCLSEHNPMDKDGLLSMWRGYGAGGNGAALIFDTSILDDMGESPLILSKVLYASSETRENWIKAKLTDFAKILHKANLADDKLYIAAHSIFERLKLFALFTKHSGFSEEKEWRVVYLPDRDTDGRLKQMFDYAIGKRGVEPKLKLKLKPIDGVTQQNVSLSNLVSNIILGPSVSSVLAHQSINRMLGKLGRNDMIEKVSPSTIPFRAL